MRKQYHFKRSKNGFFAWEVDKLIAASKNLPILRIELSKIRELHENYWYQDASDNPTRLSLVKHFELMLNCDLIHPILLASDGSVLDGMHRVCKAYLDGDKTIKAVQFDQTPKPDYVDVSPKELPYDQ